MPAGLAAEATVSGFHADNIAPALTGGFVLIRSGLCSAKPACTATLLLEKACQRNSLILAIKLISGLTYAIYQLMVMRAMCSLEADSCNSSGVPHVHC